MLVNRVFSDISKGLKMVALSISAKKWPNWNGIFRQVDCIDVLALSISAKKWPNWNTWGSRILPPFSGSIHFCEEVAQLKRRHWARHRPPPWTSYPFLRRSGPIETGIFEELSEPQKSYPFLRRSGPIETGRNKRPAECQVNYYPFLRRSGPIETRGDAAQLREIADLSISAKKWPNWNARFFISCPIIPVHYPFLRRSGPIETPFASVPVRLLPTTIHFCEEVAQLKRDVWEQYTPNRALSISAKKWPNWNTI